MDNLGDFRISDTVVAVYLVTCVKCPFSFGTYLLRGTSCT